MNDSARSTDHAAGPAPATVPAGEQSALTPSASIQLALTTIAHLADELCEHLADSQWRAAAQIRELAETTLPIAGERSMHARFEPLPTPRSQEAYDTAHALRERPGEWARIETLGNMNRANNLAYRIRTGRHRAFQPTGAFETTARSADDGTAYVYARYIGTGGQLNRQH